MKGLLESILGHRRLSFEERSWSFPASNHFIENLKKKSTMKTNEEYKRLFPQL